jgi:hypothetical protein
LNNGKHEQGTHNTKMGADSPAEKIQMPQKYSAQNVCSSPKVREF